MMHLGVTRGSARESTAASDHGSVRREAPDAAHGLYRALGNRSLADADREAPADVRRALALPGDPLPAEVRSMAGADLSSVRVSSDESARAIGAAAYTAGDHVVFAPGRYAPDTVPGMRLLLHELTHVVQQRQARQGARLPVGRGADPAEREADAMADKALRGGGIGGVVHGRTAEHVVRCDDDKRPEPHYPTEEEQKKIEEAFKRKREVHLVRPKTVPGEPAKPAEEVHGKDLTGAEVLERASRLRDPLLAAIRGKGPRPRPSGTSDEAEAFADVEKARVAVYERFGVYTSRHVTLTRDKPADLEELRKANKVLVTFTDAIDLVGALASGAARDDETCEAELKDLSDVARQQVVGVAVGQLMRTNRAELREAAIAYIGGRHDPEGNEVSLRLPSLDTVFNIAVHELIHALTHPVFRAAFRDEPNITEGFTEYFTRQVAPDSKADYTKRVAQVAAAKSAMTGPFRSLDEAAIEESLRRAYFGGQLDLIGWVPSGPKEKEAVAKALPKDAALPEWSAVTARKHAESYRNRALKAQAPSGNVLGVGLYFARQNGSDPTITVRYARVLARTDQFARGQLLAEGQLLGAPTSDPRTIGASLGAAMEYQEPHFFLTGGGRFVGTAAGGDATRLDFSPFAGGGIRAWQTIRVGAEGFVLLPIAGEGIRWGAGINLGVEFK